MKTGRSSPGLGQMLAQRQNRKWVKLAKSGRWQRTRFVQAVDAPGGLGCIDFISLTLGDTTGRI